MKKMLHMLAALIVLTAACFAQAQDNRGFYLGAAYVVTINDDCSFCDTSGIGFEAGYDINNLLSVEVRKAENEYDDFSADLSLTYFGINVGHNFNTEWFRLYTKIGYIDAEASEDGYSESDSDTALGIGVRFSPQGGQKGLQLKVETLRSELWGSYDTTVYAGVAYKF